MNSNRLKVKRVVTFGILTALAMIFSYIETLIPLPFLIPGIKLWLANLVNIICLYTLGVLATFAVSIVRVILVGFTFGNLTMMIYSLAGAILSLLCMIIAKKTKLLSMTGVSIVGGIAHNVGQIIVAVRVVENVGVYSYLPVLMISGILTGKIIGILAALVIKRISRAGFGVDKNI